MVIDLSQVDANYLYILSSKLSSNQMKLHADQWYNADERVKLTISELFSCIFKWIPSIKSTYLVIEIFKKQKYSREAGSHRDEVIDKH